MSNKIRIVEQFISIQGEGIHVGVPSLFVRLFGCNFTCSGFSNPENKPVGDIDIRDITSVAQLNGNAFTQGCDSRYAWHKDFKHLSPELSWEEALNKIRHQLEESKVKHIVWTGGEPLMNQRFMFYVMDALSKIEGLTHTIETNGSLPLLKTIDLDWLYLGRSRLLFSISPKLGHSGEPYANRFNPKALYSYMDLAYTAPTNMVDFHFKFVCGTSDHINESQLFLSNLFNEAYAMVEDNPAFAMFIVSWFKRRKDIMSIMPLGATLEQYTSISRVIAELCIKRCLRFSPRLHLNLFGNAVGT